MASKIKLKYLPDSDEEVTLSGIHLTFAQNSDQEDREEPDGIQELQVWTEDVGGGIYYVFETRRWAVSDIDDTIKLLQQLKEKIQNLTDDS